MSKKRPKLKRPGSQGVQDVLVSRPIHGKLKALAIERDMLIGGLATRILTAYLKALDAGTDWLEVRKASKGDE